MVFSTYILILRAKESSCIGTLMAESRIIERAEKEE